jgi:hypothetical protein
MGFVPQPILLGQNQFIVASNPQTIFFAFMHNTNFFAYRKQASRVDSGKTANRWLYMLLAVHDKYPV